MDVPLKKISQLLIILLLFGIQPIELTAQSTLFISDPTQTSPPISTPPGISQLPEVTVYAQEEKPTTAAPKEQSSVYGPNLSIMDIPRDVLHVSQEQLKTVMVQQVNDLVAFNPSINPTQATGNVVSEPVIRGLPATMFRNGMLVGFSSGGNWGPILNFNADDSIDTVTGPVSVVYGPQEFAGGYVNEITKQPFFDRFHGDAFYTVGMYDTNMWNIDIGGPIGTEKKLAYRFDYFGQEGYAPYNYYDGSYLNRECGYLTITWNPTDNIQINWNGEIDQNDFLPYAGINRPTQNLINSGLYQSGSWIGYYTPPTSPSQPFGQFHPGQGTPPPGFGYAINWGPLVPISTRANLFNTSLDTSRQLYAVSQAIATIQLNEELKIVNNTLFEYYQTNVAQPVPDPTWVVMPYGLNLADRLEILWTPEKENSWFSQFFDTGLAFRFLSDEEYSGSWHPTSNQADMTKPITLADASIPVPYPVAISPAYNNPFLTDIPIPSHPGEYFNVDNFASTQCNFLEFSPFVLDILHFGEKTTLFLGARVDSYFVKAQPPSGTPAVLLAPYTNYEPTSTSALLPQITISPTYRILPWMSWYATYYFGQTTAQSILGTFAPEFTSTYYHQTQSLYETGLKCSFLHDSLFLGLSAYAQSGFIPAFVLPGGTTPTVSADIQGVQLQGSYQPNNHFWINFGFNYMQGYENWTQTDGVGPTTFTPYTASVAAQYGLPVSQIISLAPGIYPFIGFPKEYGNLMLSYKFNSGFGISLWTIEQGGQFLSYDYSVRAPAWYTINASLFYATKHWEIRIWLYNLTDHHYWIAGAPGFTPARSANLEYAAFQMPFWAQAMVRINF
ncbi:TonB-dependent receptor plug domain-containing protein [Methylacidiphilum caldifontis]|uniref:TonB-dependent receptor plug domain-containing protein n=1 Tax=Methylacidiphilum caldifontis TaxID=2795386 RepID=UPI00106D1B99|nr:TonB-dependent receptor plug domain-containing protein [Methylacidiphilum caldifontis]